MATPAPVRVAANATLSHRLRHYLRILRVLAAMDFKLKYSGSALGYVWSVVKPLALFTMLYLVFAQDLQARRRSRSTTRSPCSWGSCSTRSSPTRRTSAMYSIVSARDAAAQAVLPAPGDPHFDDPRRRDHLRREPRRRRRLHRLERDPAPPQLAPARAAPARALRLHPRRLAHACDALRPLPRHRPDLGARDAAALLRHADHLSGRLPAGVGSERSPS